MKIKNKKSFTLIELLVVIAIIGLLSTVVLVSLSGVRARARNARRQSDIKEYYTAIQMAYDANGEYPDPGDDATWYCLGDYPDNKCWSNGGTNMLENATLTGILDDYIPGLPAMVSSSPPCDREGYIYMCIVRSNNQCTKFEIRWIMEGANTSCGMGMPVGGICTDSSTYCAYFESE